MKEAKTNRSLHKLMSILAATLLLLLSACKTIPIEEEIAGTYKPSSCVSLDGKEFEIEDEVLHMEKDGTGYFILHNNKYEIRWEYKDGKIAFLDSSGDNFIGTYKDRIIEGNYFNDLHYTFEKIN